MPNWCENDLRILGTLEAVQKVITLLATEEKPISFSNVIPYPENYKEQDQERVAYLTANPGDWVNAPKDGYNDGGYSWCLKNWGTKWDAKCEGNQWEWEQEDDEFSSVSVSFDTAWGPPLPVIRELIEKFPDCKFELHYYEAGSAFQGFINNESEVEGSYYGHRGG